MSPTLVESRPADAETAKTRAFAEHSSVRIKNTFIEVPDDYHQDNRARFNRCRSEPPKPRKVSVLMEDQCLQSDVSTEASPRSSVDEFHVPPVLTTAPAVAAVPPVPSPASAFIWVYPSPAPLLRPTSPSPSSTTPLRVSARAWEPSPTALVLGTPQSPSQTSSPASRKFVKELRIVTRKVNAALSQRFFITSVEVCETADASWTITARVLPQDMIRKEGALTCAKEALLLAATESKQLYVLGYKARPFIGTVEGFAATVACVREEAQACWFAVGQGFCDQEQCKWQHPLNETRIDVAVLPEIL